MSEIQEIPENDIKEAATKVGAKTPDIVASVQADIPTSRASLSSNAERGRFDEDTGRLLQALINGGTQKGIEVVRSVKQARRPLTLAA